jgi:N6-adenosine-specific RNA methylase IME4
MTEIFTSGPFAGLRKGHYRAILADPPWSFATRSDKGKDRSPEQHYECMTLDEIKALPVSQIAAKDCAMFLWVIDTHLPMAFEVLDAWGFSYKTKAFTWAKTNKGGGSRPAGDDAAWFKGMGFWTRANPEDCLLATRGAPKRRDTGKAVRRLLVAERREHSRKPDEIYDRIEELVPGPYAELFSRTERAGWDCAGQQRGRFRAPREDWMDMI